MTNYALRPKSCESLNFNGYCIRIVYEKLQNRYKNIAFNQESSEGINGTHTYTSSGSKAWRMSNMLLHGIHFWRIKQKSK